MSTRNIHQYNYHNPTSLLLSSRRNNNHYDENDDSNNNPSYSNRNNSATVATTATTMKSIKNSYQYCDYEALLVLEKDEIEQQQQRQHQQHFMNFNNNNKNNNKTINNKTTVENKNSLSLAAASAAAQKSLQNFTVMSLLFSANSGCVLACLGLATARLGSIIGAWQSGILYLSYTCSALLGATFVVKKIGSRNALTLEMGFYCTYVACFYTIATIQQLQLQQQNEQEYDYNEKERGISENFHSSNSNSNNTMMMKIAAYTGATIGGIGAGILWTAQGSYFTQAAEDYTHRLTIIRMMTTSTISPSTSSLSSTATESTDETSTTGSSTGTNAILDDTVQKDNKLIPENRGDIWYTQEEDNKDEEAPITPKDSETQAFLSSLSTTSTTMTTTTKTTCNFNSDSYNHGSTTGNCHTTCTSTTTTEPSSSSDNSTALLAGIFAFWYLLSEVALRLVATISLQFHWASWQGIFGVYTTIAILSTIAMRLCVHDYNHENESDDDDKNNHIMCKKSHWSNDNHPCKFYDNHHYQHHQSKSAFTDIPAVADGDKEMRNNVFVDRNTSAATLTTTTTTWYKITAAIQLFRTDPKMKYMVGLNAVFGLSSAFINTYVNGEVIPIVLQDPDSKYIGLLTSWSSAVAAGMSLIFAKLATASAVTTTATASSTRNGNTSTSNNCNNNGMYGNYEDEDEDDDDDNKTHFTTNNNNLHNGTKIINRSSNNNTKGYILTVGAFCFIGVVLPFVLFPDVLSTTSTSIWGWKLLLFIYSMQGIGRATFEGTLKATFADFFPYEKEGAFANMIVQSGVSSAFGYILSFNLPCRNDVDGNNTNYNKISIMASSYCVQYRDGSSQYILWFESIVIVTAIVAILGYSRAFHLHTIETKQQHRKRQHQQHLQRQK